MADKYSKEKETTKEKEKVVTVDLPLKESEKLNPEVANLFISA